MREMYCYTKLCRLKIHVINETHDSLQQSSDEPKHKHLLFITLKSCFIFLFLSFFPTVKPRTQPANTVGLAGRKSRVRFSLIKETRIFGGRGGKDGGNEGELEDRTRAHTHTGRVRSSSAGRRRVTALNFALNRTYRAATRGISFSRLLIAAFSRNYN